MQMLHESEIGLYEYVLVSCEGFERGRKSERERENM